MAGFNALGGTMASGTAPILGQAGAILGPAGSILGAAGGGIVIGGKIGEQFDKNNYGTEASDAGMIGGAVGGAAGAGVAIAAGAGAAAATALGAAAGGTAAAIIGGLAVTGIGLIAAAVLAVVFALVGDAIAHTPLLGRQVDDTLRATVLDADNFESLRAFKEETGVGFQNLMTTKKTGTGQGQINAGIGEGNVRADLLAAGFSEEEVAGIMGTGTGYGYLAGGLPFGGAGGLRGAAGDEFGMRRKKDDRGAAMLYEANYIGSEQVRMVYANAVRTFKEQGKSNEEAIDAANDVVSQHLAELGFDLTGALKTFDDQLFIAQSSFAGMTGAGTNENGRNEADLARRMQFASDGTMAQGMIDAANSWDTLFSDTMPAGLTGLDLLLVGMGEAAFQSEEVAKNAVQASIEAGGEAQKLMDESVEATAKNMAAIAEGAGVELGELTDEELKSLTEKMNIVVEGVSVAADHAFDSEAAQAFMESWGQSAAIVANTLPAILMSGEVSEGMENLVDQTADHIGAKLIEATNKGLENSIENLLSERGGMAGILQPITELLNEDMSTSEGRQFIMDNLPDAIARSKESIDQYMPQLQYLADGYQEVNDQIAVALGYMTEAEALVAKVKRDRGRDSVMGREYESAKVDNFLIDMFVGRENRAAYKKSLEELGKEGADAYWAAIIAAGGDKESVDAFLQSFEDALTESERLKAIGDMIGNSVGDGIAAALRQYALTGDTEVLSKSLEEAVNQAVFNGILTAALNSAPIVTLINSIATRQSGAYQLMTAAGMDPEEIAALLKADAQRQLDEGLPAVLAGLGFLPGLMETLGIVPPTSGTPSDPSAPTFTPSAPTTFTPAAPAERNDITYEQLRYEAGQGFIGSLGSFGGFAIEKQNPLLNGKSLIDIQSSAAATAEKQLVVATDSGVTLRDILQLLKDGEISREEYLKYKEEYNETGKITIEVEEDERFTARYS
jgi:hypothetical protein